MPELSACQRKQQLALLASLFVIYSLGGAVIEHVNTNLHYPLMGKFNPEKYPKRNKVQRNPILTGFPLWGIVGLVIWQLDALFKRLFFKEGSSEAAKVLFDFVVWTIILTLAEYAYGIKCAGCKAYTEDGLLHSYDYSYMKYNYKGVISLGTSIQWGILAVLFIRVNPYIIDFVRGGSDAFCRKGDQ